MERICTDWLTRKDDGDGDVENCFKRDARGGHAREFILNERAQIQHRLTRSKEFGIIMPS